MTVCGKLKYHSLFYTLGFSSGSGVKNLPAMQEPQQMWVQFQGGEDPLEARQPTPVSLTGKSHGQTRLAGYSSWGGKESDTTEQLSTAQVLTH